MGRGLEGRGRGSDKGPITVAMKDSGRLGSHPLRQVSISYATRISCHGRGRGFEPRRPRHQSKRVRSMADPKSTEVVGAIRCPSILARFGTTILTTLICAGRLCDATACVSTSSRILREAWLRSCWMIFTDAFIDAVRSRDQQDVSPHEVIWPVGLFPLHCFTGKDIVGTRRRTFRKQRVCSCARCRGSRPMRIIPPNYDGARNRYPMQLSVRR